jgi:D-threo-aldose 1-dehydrogenase
VISGLGFGAASLGNLYHVLDDADVDTTVKASIAAGINYYDTVPIMASG